MRTGVISKNSTLQFGTKGIRVAEFDGDDLDAYPRHVMHGSRSLTYATPKQLVCWWDADLLEATSLPMLNTAASTQRLNKSCAR